MKKFKSIVLIHIGLLLVTFSIVFFKVPNNFITGGVTGISIVLRKVLPGINVGLLMLIINSILLLTGFLFNGVTFQIMSIYSTIMISLLVWLFEKLVPLNKPLTSEPLLELITAIFMMAAGSALLFYQNASSGGTDIVARILNTRTHMHIGKTLLITDLTISIFAFFMFNIKVGLYSSVGVIIKGFLIDFVIEGLHGSKQLILISTKTDEIKRYIMENLNRGVTIYSAIGGNTNEEKRVLNTIISSRETIKLKEYIKKTDTKAFVTVSNVSEIIGKGFNHHDL